MPDFYCLSCGWHESRSWTGYGGISGEFVGPYTCRYCKAAHHVRVQKNDIVDISLTGFDLLELPADTPDESRGDYLESWRCSKVEAFQSVVGMCRRALQGAVEQKTGKSYRTIELAIDDAPAQNFIDQRLANFAHGIR